MIKDRKSCKTGCALKVSSRTISSPKITGRYSLGGTLSGPQINAAKKPSNCSRFIRRLLSNRPRTPLRRSNSASVNGCVFTRHHTLTRRARRSCVVPSDFAQNRALLAEVYRGCGLPDQVNDAISSRIGCWFRSIDLVGLPGHSILDDDATHLDTPAYTAKDFNPLTCRLPLLCKRRACEQENGEQGSPIPHCIPPWLVTSQPSKTSTISPVSQSPDDAWQKARVVSSTRFLGSSVPWRW